MTLGSNRLPLAMALDIRRDRAVSVLEIARPGRL
jgi:hypothetical protein